MSETKFSFKKTFEKFRNNKKFQTIFIVVAVVIVLLVLLFFNFGKSNSETAYSETDYVTSLENKLSEVLSKVEGAGKVSVVINVESGMETVLAMKTTTTETTYGTETVETPILVNGKTVVLKEMFPKVIGVLIVSEGASSISVMTKLQQATVSLLNINVNQIEILKMQ